MYMSANYIVSTGLRVAGFHFFTLLFLIVYLSVLVTSALALWAVLYLL
jgi:hypothetical protein